MKSVNQPGRDAYSLLLRVVALFVCTAALVGMLLVIPERTAAQAATSRVTEMQAAQAPQVPMAGVSSQKADYPVSARGADQGGFGPAMPKILPLAVITSNVDFVPGVAYSLTYSDTKRGLNDFGLMHFKGDTPNQTVLNAWMDCGYNPLVDAGQWPIWCPEDANVNGAEGPTAYWLGSKEPVDGPYLDRSIAAGEGIDGWWLSGSQYAPSHCAFLGRYLALMEGHDYLIPMVDMEYPTPNGGFYFHLRALYTFQFQNSYAICNGASQQWYVEGLFLPK
jgi:hypothetical protein